MRSLWSDPNNWSRWNSGIRSEPINGPLDSGATGTMETNRGSKHAVTFTGIEPPRHFTMTMSGPPLTAFSFMCEVRPNGTGSTIAQRVAISWPLAFIFGPMMGPMMASHFVPVLDDLGAAAEAAP